MTDTRLKVFAMVMRRLERARDTMRETFARQQDEREHAVAQALKQQHAVARAAEEVEQHESRIDSLLDCRRPVRIDELLDWQATLADAVTRRTGALDTLQRLQDVVAGIDTKLAATRTDIMRHDGRIDLCAARIDGLRREAEIRAEDFQDDEAEDAFAGRRLARRAGEQGAAQEAGR